MLSNYFMSKQMLWKSSVLCSIGQRRSRSAEIFYCWNYRTIMSLRDYFIDRKPRKTTISSLTVPWFRYPVFRYSLLHSFSILAFCWCNIPFPPTKMNRVLSGYNVRLPGLGVLLVHPLLGLLKKAHGLLRLVRQVVDDHAEILVLAEDLYFALIPGQNGA